MPILYTLEHITLSHNYLKNIICFSGNHGNVYGKKNKTVVVNIILSNAHVDWLVSQHC